MVAVRQRCCSWLSMPGAGSFTAKQVLGVWALNFEGRVQTRASGRRCGQGVGSGCWYALREMASAAGAQIRRAAAGVCGWLWYRFSGCADGGARAHAGAYCLSLGQTV